MTFIKYRKELSFALPPLVSIANNGRINFHKLTVENYKINSFKYGILSYDPTYKKIGIEFTNNEQEVGTYKIHHDENSSYIINGRFLDYFGIRPKHKTTHYIRYDGKANMLIVFLRRLYRPVKG